MKKNVVGHMMSPKISKKTRLKRLDLFSRFLCLLIALIVWLLVVNIQSETTSGPDIGTDVTVTLP